MMKSGLPKKEGKMRIRAFPVSFYCTLIAYIDIEEILE
jgi:hypothetical protein